MVNIKSILEKIDFHVENKPEKIAVCHNDKSLSYKQLNSVANQLANYIKAQGIRKEDTVALCVERSLELTIGMLGIFKSGAIYIPLDPDHPKQRHDILVNDTEVKLVITSDTFKELEKYSEENLLNVSPDQVAYIMYTSGSTGKPKGVMVDHGNLIERYEFAPYNLLITGSDRIAAITAVSWNPSIYECFYTLASGATIVMIDMDDVRDPNLLKQVLEKQEVTFLRAVPSLLQALVDTGWSGNKDLTIVSHGDKLPAKLADELRKRGKGVYNTYGSTEATVFSMIEITESNTKVIPISTNESDQGKILILTPDLKETAIDEVGEVFISGRVVAKGYFNDPKLTSEKFLTASDGSRLYKTGDVAKKLENGSVQFLGRSDNQVKVRGQRVELGEVEAGIAGYPGIKSIVAHTIKDASQNNQLVAYIISKEEIKHSDLRNYLLEKLPSAMIPSFFVEVSKFPLNRNGKVDRKALPHPREVVDSTQDLAQTNTEISLTHIFCEVLKRKNIGRKESFFEIGGHSLLAALVCTRIEEETLKQLSLKAFYNLQNIEKISSYLDSQTVKDKDTYEQIEIQKKRNEMPLSFSQDRLWFMNKLAADDAGYNIPFAIKLVGKLNIDALKLSLQQIYNKHESLRTRFSLDLAGRPVQSIQDKLEVDLEIIEQNNESFIKDVMSKDSTQAFDLSTAPLIRHKLFILDDEKSIVYFNFHHIISDGWSKAIFRKELTENYNACCNGKEHKNVKLEVQYLDFALWNRNFLKEEELQKQIDYWTSELEDVTPLNMPTDRIRPTVLSQNGAIEKITVPTDILDKLHDLALKSNASLYMLLLSAFKVLIHKYSHETDIAIGSPYAGRDRSEVEQMIGFFVNTIILRTQIDFNTSFLELVNQVKSKAFGAFENKDLSFERLVSEINPERDLSRYPITQTIFALQNTPFDEIEWNQLKEEEFSFRAQRTRYDLELHAWERKEGLVCHLIYNTDLFDAWRMKQFLGHFERLLNILVEHPEIKLAEINLLSQKEEQKIIIDWNKTQKEFNQNICIHEIIESIAKEQSSHLAVSFQDIKLSYKVLNEKANQLAHFLQKQGVKKSAHVAIRMCRSSNLIVAKLAIIKCGAVYIPIDTDFPNDRIEYMLEDSNACYVVTDSDFEKIADEANSNLNLDISSNEAIYMIYTSGSTGRPKGAKIKHRSVVNLVSYIKNLFRITPEDKSIYFSGTAFDAGAFEIWSILTSGASLYIPDNDTRMATKKLLNWVENKQLSICFFMTGIAELVFNEGVPNSVRIASCGGDRLMSYPPKGFPRFFNFYGPTENTVISTASEVNKNEDFPSSIPTIGRPIANQQCYIVDTNLKPVPIGVPGELIVSGEGISTGYYNKKELTDTKFIQNPFKEGIAYKTGDLARFLPNGEIQFLGRIDHQVQLRGYRIETGEINNTLLELPQVKEAYTHLREDTPGDQRLVTYITVSENDESEILEQDHVELWKTLYDREYGKEAQGDKEFNITGWNSSFSGGAIPAEAMKEWVDETIARILAYSPKEVFEIGCGTGLLMYPLAKSVKHYTGTDLSSGTIHNIQKDLDQKQILKDKIEVHNYPAHDFSWHDGEKRYDFALSNSVVQYFPSEKYLLNVIREMTHKISKGGKIFIGDVRNHDLLYPFHLRIELSSEKPEPVTNNLLQKVKNRVAMDKELLSSPDFFRGLVSKIKRVSAVEIKPKLGHHFTEMNMFRYDVILHIDSEVTTVKPKIIELANFEDALKNEIDLFLIKDLKDIRNYEMIHAFDKLKSLEKTQKTQSFLAKLNYGHMVKIDELVAQAKRYDKKLDFRLGPGSKHFEALVVDANSELNYSWNSNIEGLNSKKVSSDPLQLKRVTNIRPKIREYLAKKLPDYMIPSQYVFLDQIPLTPNGKVDIEALPAPTSDRPVLEDAYKAASTEIEEKIAGIFAKSLGLEIVGVQDNFFELGGHSLLAVQLLNQIEDATGVEVPLSKFFEKPNVSSIVDLLDDIDPTAKKEIYLDKKDVKKLPLNAMDLNFHFARFITNDKKYGWYQVMELETLPLNIEKIKKAILYAININPMARGCISSVDALGSDLYWDVSQKFSRAPLEIHQVEDRQEQDRLIQKFSHTPLSIDEAPLCRFVLIQGGASDRLLLRYNHGAIDGSGIQALLNSVMSNYCGLVDPALKFNPFSTDELYDYYDYNAPLGINNNEMGHIKGVFPKWLFPQRKGQAKWVNTSIFKLHKLLPTPLHSVRGEHSKSSCFAAEVVFTSEQTQHLKDKARELKVPLDRLFMVGILTAAKIWNQNHGSDYKRIEAYWAVNLRPPKLFDSIVGNMFGWSRLRVTGPEHEEQWKKELLDPKANFLVQGALDWVHVVKDLIKMPLPSFIKKFIIKIATKTAPTLFISNTLSLTVSNGAGETLSQDFGVKRMQNHSYLVASNRPVIVIAQQDGNFKLRMNTPRSIFDQEAATEYLILSINKILDL